MKQTELIIGVGILLLMTLRLLVIYPYASLLITQLTLVLSILYFFFSVGLLNQIGFRNLFKTESYKGISTLRIIGTVGTGLVLSIMTISILFKFQRWPYGSINLLIGLISLFPIVGVVLIKFINTKTKLYKSLLIRLTLIFGIGLLLFLTKSETILEMTYSDFPDYVEAMKNEMKDPENIELQRIANEERLKMESEN
ncbi:hypothetical protein [Winogradskyella psychrotolerans]|uniref:hypothetical protein n=1 Tax=Winogradskyella psychrotolerans TaxID=1344585 RepID=UPI001C077C8D|nr:hypothetical protein [Winogradskyella psychrotolerans]MBU2928589.1 hypothetical protein [Winogradskyella psychrotolerans]